MSTDNGPESSGGLKRVLGLTSLVLYGLGIIIGAGIYVLIGAVVARAEGFATLSFILAGGLAVLTGLSYAELSTRYPEAAGAAAYVRQAFDSDLFGKITGLAVAVMGITAAASITRGGVFYLQHLVPLSAPVAGGAVIIIFTALACYGVVESVMAAALMSIIEIGGLLLVIAAGVSAMPGLGEGISMIPDSLSAWGGVGAGAFLAFFAFAGFENLANMAEEARDVRRVLPKAILLAICISAALYIAVLIVALTIVPLNQLSGADAPLMLIVNKAPWLPLGLFSVIAVIATLNGVLIEIIMLSRLTYGMARRRWLPASLAKVHPTRQTPVIATLIIGAIVFTLTVAVPFGTLARAVSGILLMIFFTVNLALWRLQRTDPRPELSFTAPRWTAPAGAVSCLLMIIAEVSGGL